MQKRVLVIDDDAGLRDLLQTILEIEGCEVILAENGLIALEKLKTVQPDLILLDLMMPHMDGFTFAEELQRQGLYSAIPILALTADTRAKTKIEQMGFDSYLTKPFELHRFLEEIAKLMEPIQAY